MNDGWHDGSTENVVAHLDGSVEMVVAPEMSRMNVMEDGGCA